MKFEFFNKVGWFLMAAALALLFAVSISHAVPTPTVKSIVWDHSGENLSGIMIYYAMESEPEPRVYDDSRRIDVADETARSVLLLSVMAAPSGPMCFRLTAYSQPNETIYESDFTEQFCGFFGFEALINAGIQ